MLLVQPPVDERRGPGIGPPAVELIVLMWIPSPLMDSRVAGRERARFLSDQKVVPMRMLTSLTAAHKTQKRAVDQIFVQ